MAARARLAEVSWSTLKLKGFTSALIIAAVGLAGCSKGSSLQADNDSGSAPPVEMSQSIQRSVASSASSLVNIKIPYDGLCVEFRDGHLLQEKCDSTNVDQAFAVSVSGSYVKIATPGRSGECLQDNSGNIVSSACSSSKSQLWSEVAAQNGIHIVNVGSKQCLNVAYVLTQAGGGLITYGCDGEVNEQFVASAAQPSISANAFSISSLTANDTIKGVVAVKGVAGSQWVNVSAYDTSNWQKVGADSTPVNGAFSLKLNSALMADGAHTIAFVAFSVKAGQSGGKSATVDLALNVSNAAVVSPTPVPTPIPTPVPTPVPNPVGVAANAFSISSPVAGASLSGQVAVTGVAGSQWVNVAAYDSVSGAKVGADAAPSNGGFSMNLNSSLMSNGSHSIVFVAFSVPAGQLGGTSTSVSQTYIINNGSVVNPTPVPTPRPTPVPTPVPPPVATPVGFAANALSVSSPAAGSTLTGQVVIKGIAGSQWVNVAAYDSVSGSKVGSDATPSNGAFSMNLNSTSMSNGSHVITFVAFSVPAGQLGGTSTSVSMTYSVSNAAVVPTPTPTPVPTPAPTPVSNPSGVPAALAGQNYVVTFDDEFTSLSDISAGADYNGANWYNGTEQCCMSDTSGGLPAVMYPTVYNGQSANPYSLINGGGLNITLSKVNNVWYSGVMTSVDRTGKGFSQQYGYFEISAKLSGDYGTWPAFWMLNLSNLTGGSSSTGGNGEIDIFEQYTTFHNGFCTTFHDWSAGTTPYYNCGIQVADVTNGFHRYGLLWTASTMSIYFDDVLVAQTATPSVMKQPYYMLVDMGLGGGWPTDQTPSSSTMQVKYVRAYQLK